MDTFKVGDKVEFGRDNGEKTQGVVLKVNPTTLKVQTLEARGNGRGSHEGAVWKVPPSLCRLLGSANMTVLPAASLPPIPPLPPLPKTKTADASFKVGDIVVFGNAHGNKTLGKILKVNPSKYQVQTLECRGNGRGSSAGAIWTVPPSLMRLATEAEKTDTAAAEPPLAPWTPFQANKAPTFKTGDRVEFTAKGKLITGTVEKVNAKSIKVRPDLGPQTWMVSPNFLRASTTPALPFGGITVAPASPLPKRTEGQIMQDISSVYCRLSPENLHCDGEISRSEAARRATKLNARLRELFNELGRRVSEEDAYQYEYAAERARHQA